MWAGGILSINKMWAGAILSIVHLPYSMELSIYSNKLFGKHFIPLNPKKT